jgi:integrase/recombinase XerD
MPDLEAAATEYLSHCRRAGFSRWTLRAYRRALDNFLAFVKEQYPEAHSVTDLSRQMIAAYQMHLYKTESRYGKRLSLSTQFSWMGVVLWWLRWMLAQQRILINPGASIQLPRRPKRIPRNYLSVKEMQKLLRAPDLETHIGLRDRAILEVLYSTGIRAGELCRLKLEDLNATDGWLTVREGKGGKDRVVPLGRAALHFVQLYLEKTRSTLLHEKNSPFVFANKHGRPLGYVGLNRLVSRNAKLAGIKRPVTPHSLRHTCATQMLRGRADIRHIQELLGHSSLSSTQIYTRVEIGDLKKVHAKCHPRERQPLDKK